MEKYKIYTDGCALGNPGSAGFGIVVTKNSGIQKKYYKGYHLSTNNRMELLAVIFALELFKKKIYAEIYTDSNYVVSAIEKGWLNNWMKNNWIKSDGKPVKNQDLWIRFYKIYSNHIVKLVWIKGHSGHLENEMCDKLANYAARLPYTEKLNDHGFSEDE